MCGGGAKTHLHYASKLPPTHSQYWDIIWHGGFPYFTPNCLPMFWLHTATCQFDNIQLSSTLTISWGPGYSGSSLTQYSSIWLLRLSTQRSCNLIKPHGFQHKSQEERMSYNREFVTPVKVVTIGNIMEVKIWSSLHQQLLTQRYHIQSAAIFDDAHVRLFHLSGRGLVLSHLDKWGSTVRCVREYIHRLYICGCPG